MGRCEARSEWKWRGLDDLMQKMGYVGRIYGGGSRRKQKTEETSHEGKRRHCRYKSGLGA